jgi:hypothetical protein
MNKGREKMTDETIYMSASDGSEATLAQHMDWTPDEEWSDAGYASVDSYFEHLIASGLLIEKQKKEGKK